MQSELKEIRRTLHKNPEVGDKLPATKAFVMDKLRQFGYEPVEICESGITAVISGRQSGKTIMLRADMDALPITEEAEVEFKSENGCMHACGHDMHTTMLLGAAKLLKENSDKLKGTVKLVFQPDEEGFTGAKKMLAANVLESPKVDAAMALHVHSGSPSGIIIHGTGVSIAGCYRFRITVDGTGCHGAMPHTGVDPINICVHIYLALQELITREIPATDPVVLTIGKILGGDAANIIPGQAIMEGTLRCLNKELSEKLVARMGEITATIASAFRGSARLEELSSVPPLKNDDELTSEMDGYARELIGSDKVISFSGGGMGSEDFASYSYRIPCAYFMLGAGSSAENALYGKPMHNSKIVFNEDILPIGAAVLADCAIRWLGSEKRG